MRILLAGVPKYQLDRLHSVLNLAARLIFGYSRYDHITPLLRDQLHWLRVTQRIDFKRCLMVFKALHGLAQATSRTIVSESRQSSGDRVCVLQVTTVWLCRLRQSAAWSRLRLHLWLLCQSLDKPAAIETLESTFCKSQLSGPTTCNSLSDSVKDAYSIDVFRSRLKTYVFRLSYGSTEFFNLVVNAPLFYKLFMPTGYGAI